MGAIPRARFRAPQDRDETAGAGRPAQRLSPGGHRGLRLSRRGATGWAGRVRSEDVSLLIATFGAARSQQRCDANDPPILTHCRLGKSARVAFCGIGSMKAREATLADKAATIELWKRCALTRPWNDP